MAYNGNVTQSVYEKSGGWIAGTGYTLTLCPYAAPAPAPPPATHTGDASRSRKVTFDPATPSASPLLELNTPPTSPITTADTTGEGVTAVLGGGVVVALT